MWKAFQKEKFKYALSFASILRRQKKITFFFFFFSPHRELSCSIPVFADTMTNVKELQIKQVFTARLHSVLELFPFLSLRFMLNCSHRLFRNHLIYYLLNSVNKHTCMCVKTEHQLPFLFPFSTGVQKSQPYLSRLDPTDKN